MEHTLELPNALFSITYATAIFQELNPEHSTLLYITSNEKILSAIVSSCGQSRNYVIA
jgi:hypothetical protein